MSQIPVIDLFAGPGGLGEGFSSFGTARGAQPYRIALSVEADSAAHETLELRAFFRQFKRESVPEDYYRHLKGEVSRGELFARYKRKAEAARWEAWKETLGEVSEKTLDKRIRKALGSPKPKVWVLIGGPPCQAYSIAGRSRSGGIKEEDDRVYLYEEYLRILAVHRPPVFVMENVKGLLSSKLADGAIFDRIRNDLQAPYFKFPTMHLKKSEYHLHSFARTPQRRRADGHPDLDPEDFVIRSEDYGIPQARHRVIILGIRRDLRTSGPFPLDRQEEVPVRRVLCDLPPLRSGLSRGQDAPEHWRARVRAILEGDCLPELRRRGQAVIADMITTTAEKLMVPKHDRGGEFVPVPARPDYRAPWFADRRLGGVSNHSSRGHMYQDLHRYLFSACVGYAEMRSPELSDFPTCLLPNHRNIAKAIEGGCFSDRFRVQLANRPSTTITCHIAKDGHYYIHYDPAQCRSLTVREAARLQTFPDNYFFCGNRTEQYKQVGNAVPPLLAQQLAGKVYEVLREAKLL